MTRETGDPVLITEATRAAALGDDRGRSRAASMEIRGYDEPIELYAPLIPQVMVPGEGGADVSEPLGAPTRTHTLPG